jgi:AGZA family xanthine/uracil permease-like MFS transporter
VVPVLNRFFQVAARGSSIRREVLGGITTFVAMAYIIVVNPAILHAAGIPRGPSTLATILTAAFGSLLMGLYANRPIAVAPYMGENAFIAFGLVALGATWEQRLGSVFVAGVVFLVLTLFHLRSKLANAISPSLIQFAAGIGLFLAFIGLYETGIVTSGAAGLPRGPLAWPNCCSPRRAVIGAFHHLQVLLAIAGFVVTVVLMIRKIPGAILIGMGATAAAGYAIGLGPAPAPADLIAMPFTGGFTLSPIALHLDVAGVLKLSFLPVLLTLVLMSFLDTLGTLVGVGAAGDMLDKDGNFPQIERPMLVDAVSCIFASLSARRRGHHESATDPRALHKASRPSSRRAFLASLLLLRSWRRSSSLKYLQRWWRWDADGRIVRKIDLGDWPRLPAPTSTALMVFTYNIANGLTAGLVLLPDWKVVAGRARELGWGSPVSRSASRMLSCSACHG